MAVVGPKAGAESPVAVEVAAEAVPMAQAAVHDGLACRAWTCVHGSRWDLENRSQEKFNINTYQPPDLSQRQRVCLRQH